MIKYIILLLSCLLSFFTSINLNIDNIFINILYGVLFVIIYYIAFVFLFFFSAFLFTFFISGKRKREKYNRFYKKLYTFYTRFCLSLFNIKINVEGMDIVPQDHNYLVVQNHASNMDPIILNFVLRRDDLIFVSKESLFKIPFWGRMIYKCGYLKLKRDNSRDDVNELNRGIDWMKKRWCSIAVYPEGTRNKHVDEIKLQEFRAGCFNLATKSNSPIVISTIEGTENVNNGLLFKRHDVTVKFLKTLYPEDYKDLKTKEISDIVYNEMINNFEYHKI